MLLNKFACTQCNASMKSAAGVEVGKALICPKCKARFVVTAPAVIKKPEPAADDEIKLLDDAPAPPPRIAKPAPAKEKPVDLLEEVPAAPRKKSKPAQPAEDDEIEELEVVADEPKKPAKKPARPAADSDDEIEELDVVDDEPKKPRKKAAPVEEPEELEELEELPSPPRKKPKRRTRDEEEPESVDEEEDDADEEEEEDEKPRRGKKGGRRRGKQPTFLRQYGLYLGIGGGVLVVGVVVLIILLFGSSKKDGGGNTGGSGPSAADVSDPANQGDLTGQWAIADYRTDGGSAPVDKSSQITFTKSKMTIEFMGTKDDFAITIDPVVKAVLATERGQQVKWLFKFEGGKLMLCRGEKGPPTSFEPRQAGNFITLITLKRVPGTQPAPAPAAPAAPAAQPGAPANASSLQGTWVAVGLKYEGKVMKPREYQDSYMTFNGNEVTLDIQDEPQKGTFTINTAAKPMTLLLDLEMVQKKGPREKIYGIFYREGETLNVCFERGGQISPAAFGSGRNIIEYSFKLGDRKPKVGR